MIKSKNDNFQNDSMHNDNIQKKIRCGNDNMINYIHINNTIVVFSLWMLSVKPPRE
jgi:hypothetical protein